MDIYSEKERPTRDAMLVVRDGTALIDNTEMGALLIDRHGFLVRIDGRVYTVTVAPYEIK